MKWLVTDTLKAGASARYLGWLERLNIEGELIAPPGRRFIGPGYYDALLLTGGGDVDPQLYLERKSPETKQIRRDRDDLEIDLVRYFLEARKPVFGICRGMQVLNVAFRGRLIQHLPSYLKDGNGGREQHGVIKKKDSVHPVSFVEGTLLQKAMAGVTEVNSAHHQAIDPERLGTGMRVAALSAAGVIEAIEGVGFLSPILAVQWHPERMSFEDHASGGLLRLMHELTAERMRASKGLHGP